jgi:putative ABC transport system permease protein
MKFNFFLKNKKKSDLAVLSKQKVKKIAQKKPKETWTEKHSGISFAMIFYIGWKNLKMGRMRSALTIGGVALGIGIVTFLLSIGFGMQRMIITEVTKDNPVNVIDVNNGNLNTFVSLNKEFIKKIKDIKGVKEISRRVNTGGKIILGESQTDVIIYGADRQYLEMEEINYKKNGGKFSDDKNEAIISDRLAKLLHFNKPSEAIGKTITYNIAISKEISSRVKEEKIIKDNKTTISGVIMGTNSAFMYLPFKIVAKKFNIDGAQEGKVVVDDMKKFSNIKQQLEQIGFTTSSINELVAGINSFFSTVRIVLIIFGVIIMSISAMGMLNTLSISLLQRTKEIGILKALGAKRTDVFRMFILESIIISLIGGILGFFGGYGLALLMNKTLIFLGHKMGKELGFFVYVPMGFVLTISGFVVFLGLMTGILPAFRAAKIHALEALRYE